MEGSSSSNGGAVGTTLLTAAEVQSASGAVIARTYLVWKADEDSYEAYALLPGGEKGGREVRIGSRTIVLVSSASPLGSGLSQASLGDIVLVRAGNGAYRVQVVSVDDGGPAGASLLTHEERRQAREGQARREQEQAAQAREREEQERQRRLRDRHLLAEQERVRELRERRQEFETVLKARQESERRAWETRRR